MNKLFLLLLLVMATQLAAQPDFDRLLKENTYPLDDSYKGAGWNFIIKEGASADYFLLGEDHGIAEVAEIAQSLFRTLNQNGFEHLAIETGPYSAKLLSELVKANDPAVVKNFYNTNAFSIPFYGNIGEFDVLKAVFEVSKSSTPIWGLDQEFILSARALLAKHAAGFSGREAIQKEITNAKKGYDLLLSEKKHDDIWLMNQTAESWQVLESMAKDKETREMLSELKASQEIYQLNFAGKFKENNDARVAHFIEWFEKNEAENKQGKVMIKMGLGHSMKGENIFGVNDLGDYLAKKKDKTTFHLGLIQISGYQNIYVPFREKSAMKTEVQAGPFQGFLDFIDSVTPTEGAVVLNVKALQPFIDDLPDDKITRRVIHGYDALLLYANATPSTFIE